MNIMISIANYICHFEEWKYLLGALLLLKGRHYRSLLWICVCLTLADLYIIALKLTFTVPMFPHLGVGYAFPSGHMNLSIVFWVFMAHQYPRFDWLLMLWLPIAGSAIVLMNYHTTLDVFGAVFFAFLFLWILQSVLKYFDFFPITSLHNRNQI